MRRADRLFDIIQILRVARAPVTAAAIADELEVAARTVYRDIATLQARRVPIEGAAGFGYVLRRGFELPPLMFTEEEAEAIIIALRLLPRTGDPALVDTAAKVHAKLVAAVPEGLRGSFLESRFHVSRHGPPVPTGIDLAQMRAAIRAARKMRIAYVDAKGETTERVVRPVAVEYYTEATLLCAWCELRDNYRHFRADRIRSAQVLEESFAAQSGQLLAGWLALARPA